jgi:hypothetical protein
MAVTNQQVADWLAASPNLTDAEIASAMQQFGVSAAQMAEVTGIDAGVVQARYEAAAPAPALGSIGADPLESAASFPRKDTAPSKTPEQKIYEQLVGQQKNLGTEKYFQTGAAGSKEGGLGSTEAVLRDMAKTLAGAGLTSIEQFGRGPLKDPVIVQPELVEEARQIGLTSRGRPAYEYVLVPNGRWYTTQQQYDGEGGYSHSTSTYLTPEQVASYGVTGSQPQTVMVDQGRTGFINKETGEDLTAKFPGWGGQGWGGTSAGDGQTVYDVNFDPATGLPIFYNRQTHGRDRYAGLLQAIAIGTAVFAPQIGAAILGAGAPAGASLALGSAISGFVGSGGDLETGIKAGLASFLGGQAGSWAAGASNSALVGNIAGNMTRAAILGGNMEQALVSSLVQAAPAEIIKHFPNFAELPRAAQEAAVAVTVDLMRSGGENLDAIALKGATDGLTDYTLQQIPGYNDLRKGQQDVVRERISNVVRGESLSNEVLQGAIQMGSEAVRYQADTDRAVKAGWKTLEEQQAATSMFGGKVTPAQFADKMDTTEAEAKQIARDILGREPTEFEYMQLIGLSENTAAQNSDLKAIRYDESTFDSNELAEAYKAVYGKEPTKEFLESPEAFDMLGRSDAQGRNQLQNAYIKDKNWVTEEEATQFWKDMGNTGPVPQQFMDSMLMTTENGAKAMAETHRINAEDIAATTFDGSQYETPQEAAAAAKAAGFNAFTHKDKNLTYVTQSSPVEEAKIRADVEEKKTFSEAFAAARKELGAGKTFTWNGKQYTTNVLPKDTFDASRSSTLTTAATLAIANGKEQFIGPDGKTYKLDDNAKSVLANSVNQSEAETQRLLRQAIKPATNETAAETQRLMESGTRGAMDVINAMAAQALGTTQRGLGNFLSNAGKTYAAMTGDLDFDNALIKIGKEVESYAQGSDIYGLDVQKTRLSQAMARANETDNWIEKTKILGSAIGKNSLGFFDVAGSEVAEELPETILQIGAALMTGGGTLAASGAVAAIGAAGSVMEAFGSTVEDTYKKAKKAGDSDSEAMNKAYINGVLGTAIEVGTNFVADKAMLAPFLNKFTGTLAGTATGFVSSTTIGAASQLAAGLSQSYATQYMVNPETASLSKAATDGIFEMFIGGTAQGTMGLPGYAIQGGAIIGKDYFGKDVTMADVAAGAVLDSSTVNPNTTIATSEDGDPVTLGGAMLQMPNYQFDMSTLKTYVPQVFNNDNLIVGQDELGNDVTFGDLMGQTTEFRGFDEVYKNLLNVTPQQRYDLAQANSKPAPVVPTPTPETPPATEGQVISVNPDDGTALVVDGGGNVNVVDNTDGSLKPGDIVPTTPPAETEVPVAPKPPVESELPVVPELPAVTEGPVVTSPPVDPSVTPTADAPTTTTDTPPVVSTPPTTGITSADVEKIVNDALKANPNLTASDVQKIVDDAVSVMPNLTADQVKQIVGDELSKVPAAATPTDVQTAVDKAKADLTRAIEAVSTGVSSGNADLRKVIEDLKAAGLTPEDVQQVVDASAANQSAATKQAIADATAGLATTTQLSDLQRSLSEEIQAAKDIGFEGDAAIQAGLDSLATKVGTNQAGLLAQLGTTAADLRAQFATDIAASQTATAQEIANTKAALETAIADAKASGLQGDAALKSAIDAVAANQQTSAADLLTKLGTTEAGLKTEFAAGLAGVSAEVADTRKALEDAIQAAKDIGLEGDAALQAGIDSVVAELGTTKEALLGRLGTTEETLRGEFATGITGLETQMRAQYDALTAAQKAEADARLAQGQTLAEAIAAAQATTSGQISELEAQTKAQYDSLSAAQKATADALIAQGQSMQQAITAAQQQTAGQIADVESRLTDAIAAAEAMGLTRDQAITAAVDSVAAELGTTKEALLAQMGTTEAALRTEFTAGLAGVSAEVKAAYDSLSAEQKALANQLTTQGSTLAEAIEAVRTEAAGQIGALSADMQAKYDALTAEQKALANDMAQQGMDLNAAINLAQQQTQAQITGLGQQVDARINELMQQGQTYQEATQQAIGELNTKNQQLQGLVGTQGRQATQADIDAMSQMLGGQRAMDLTYDVTGDKQVTQDDIDFLTQVVGGVNTDWRAPVGSAFGPTGLYGQLAANEAQRQADLRAQQDREQAAAAEAARQAQISGVRGTLAKGQQTFQQAAQQLPQAYRQAQETTTPIYGQMGEYLDLGAPLDVGFFQPSAEKQAGTKQQQPTKIAAGGYIDDLLAGDMTADDLLNLLR